MTFFDTLIKDYNDDITVHFSTLADLTHNYLQTTAKFGEMKISFSHSLWSSTSYISTRVCSKYYKDTSGYVDLEVYFNKPLHFLRFSLTLCEHDSVCEIVNFDIFRITKNDNIHFSSLKNEASWIISDDKVSMTYDVKTFESFDIPHPMPGSIFYQSKMRRQQRIQEQDIVNIKAAKTAGIKTEDDGTWSTLLSGNTGKTVYLSKRYKNQSVLKTLLKKYNPDIIILILPTI